VSVEDHQSVIHDTITSPYERSTDADYFLTSGSATSGYSDQKEQTNHMPNHVHPSSNQAHSLDSIQ
jgi:hypothetical protein